MRRVFTAALMIVFVTSTANATLDSFQEKAINRAAKILTKSKDANERRKAALDLSRFEVPEVVAPLTAALGDPDPSVRRQAADSLWRVSEVAEPAESALRDVLDDPSLGVRVRAAAALEALGVDESELVAARVSGLEADRLRDRILAARDLVGFVDADRLTPPIIDVAAAEAETSIWDLGETYLSPVVILERLVRRDDLSFVDPVMAAVEGGNPGRRFLLTGLEGLDPKPEEWNTALIALLGSARLQDRTVGLGLLRGRNTQDAGVEEWIAPATTALDDPETRNDALWSLQEAGGFAASAAPEIAELVAADQDEDIRKRAAEALEKIGDRNQAFPTETLRGVAEAALPALTTAAVDDPDGDVRRAAVGALGELWVHAGEVLPTFVAVASDDPVEQNRFSALLRIRNLGTDASSAADQLAVIVSTDPANRATAEQALRAVREDAPEFDPSITTGGAETGGGGSALADLRAKGVDFGPEQMWRALADLDEETARLLLNAGIDPNERLDDVGMRPLHTLFFGGCRVMSYPSPPEVTTLTTLLLERGADPNIEDDRGNTALKLAASNCDGAIARILIEAGADMYATGNFGMTVFDTAIGVSAFSGNDVPEVFIDAGFRMTPESAAQHRKNYADNQRILDLLDRASATGD